MAGFPGPTGGGAARLATGLAPGGEGALHGQGLRRLVHGALFRRAEHVQRGTSLETVLSPQST